MSLRLPFALALATALPLLAGAQDAGARDGVRYAQLTIRERVVIRVPRVGRAAGRNAPAPLSPLRWKEKKGPKCLAIATLRGVSFNGDDQVDLILAGNERIRAKLDGDCPALDFYSGFYIKPTVDGQVCADRDAIRSRSGAVCPIDRFRRLEAKR